jgi:hypothetical protein
MSRKAKPRKPTRTGSGRHPWVTDRERRDVQVFTRLNEDEAALLDAIVAAEQAQTPSAAGKVTRSSMLRQLVVRAHEAATETEERT